MDLLDDKGDVIGTCELLDKSHTDSMLYFNNVAVNKTLTMDELRALVFKFESFDGNWVVTNIPVMFGVQGRTILASYGSSDLTPVEFSKL